MVVRRGKTSYGSSDRAFKAIDRNKLLGVVFNDVQPMLFHTYYNFGYYQYGNNRKVYSDTAKIRNTPKNAKQPYEVLQLLCVCRQEPQQRLHVCAVAPIPGADRELRAGQGLARA